MATLEISESMFAEIIESNKLVILDFWAEWCGPCKMMIPIFEEVSKEMNNLNFAKLNTKDYGDIVFQRY